MQLLVLASLLAVVVCQQAQAPRPYDPAPEIFAALIASAPSSNEAAINAANAKRQHEVNRIALNYGVSIGTAPYYGVPGTSVKGAHNRAVHAGTYGYGHNRVYGYANNAGYGYGGLNRIPAALGHGLRYGQFVHHAASQTPYGHGHNLAHTPNIVHAHNPAHLHSHNRPHSHLTVDPYQIAQAAGPAPTDQPAGPSPADQPLGPSPADQLTGPTPADQQAGPTEYDQQARPFDPAPAAFNEIFATAPSHNEEEINKDNARRQHSVNRIALYYGRSVGTAPYYGVPGTPIKGRHNGAAYNGAYGYNTAPRGAYGYQHNTGYVGYGGIPQGHALPHHTYYHRERGFPGGFPAGH